MLKTLCHRWVTLFRLINKSRFNSVKRRFSIGQIYLQLQNGGFFYNSILCSSNANYLFGLNPSRTQTSIPSQTKPAFKKNNLYPQNMNTPDLEVSYYISTGEFLLQSDNSSLLEGKSHRYHFWVEFLNSKHAICPSLIKKAYNTAYDEEERYSFFLRQLRYEEFVQDGESTYKGFRFDQGNRILIKVMSYNVLSQQLLEQHMYLYRRQAPYTLRWDYRHPRLFAQIRSEDPDILCLQEVQESHMEGFYNKLEDLGYKGILKLRTGGKTDGCAIYYKENLLKLVKVSLVEYFQPGVQLLNRDNVGIVARLRPRQGGKDLVVATTHLLYNPKRTDVRLAQMQVFLAEVDRLSKLYGHECGVIITGDLNSQPSSKLVQFLKEGSLIHTYKTIPPYLGILASSKHEDASTSKLHSSYNPQPRNEEEASGVAGGFSPGEGASSDCQKIFGEEEKSEDATVKIWHDFKFSSVYPLKSDSPSSPVTTYHDRWVTVDYIFYTCCDQLNLLSRLRLPTSEESSRFIRNLPNYASPSDHLPLAATFALRLD